MIVPRSRLLWFTALAIVPAAAVAGAAPQGRMAAAIVLFALIAIAAVDAALAPRSLRGIGAALPDLVRLTRRRKGSIGIRLTHDGVKARLLRVGVAFPQEIESPDDDTWTTLPAGAPACRIECACTASKRGSYKVDKLYLEAGSPLGFWCARAIVTARCEIRVYPDLLREGKRLAAQMMVRGGVGVHRQRQIGRGREFEKLREYLPGDDYGEIHWKATARRGHPVTKVFQIERTQEVYVVIDASRLTARPIGEAGDTILERFVAASLLFGLAAEREGDRFGLAAFSDRVHGFVRAQAGKAHYSACQEALYALHPRLVAPDYEELCAFLRTRLRRRALLIFLTELDDPVLAESFERAIGVLRRQHLVIAAMLAPAEARPLFSGPEPESIDQVYERLGGHFIWHGLREVEMALRRQGVRLSMLDPGNLAAQLTSLYLNVKQRQLL